MLLNKMKVQDGRVVTKDETFETDYKGIKIYSESHPAAGKVYYYYTSAGQRDQYTSIADVKKSIDRTAADSKTKDHGYVVNRIGDYEIIEGAGIDGGWWFAKEVKGKSPLETKKFKTKAQAEEHATMSSDSKDSKTKDDDIEMMTEQETKALKERLNKELDIAIKNGNSAEVMRIKRDLEKAVAQAKTKDDQSEIDWYLKAIEKAKKDGDKKEEDRLYRLYELAKKDMNEVGMKTKDEATKVITAKIGDIKKNMDAARKMGYDCEPYKKQLEKLTKDADSIEFNKLMS